MKHKIINHTLIFFMLLTSSIMSMSSVNAQTSSYAPGASIIFVVDQSGSMSAGPIMDSSGRRGPPSDPNGLALLALNSGIQPIFQRIVLSELERISVDMLGQEHEVGVVLFGGGLEPESSSVEIAVPLTKIQVQRDAQGNISSNLDALLPKTPKNLGDTSFSSAFQAVCSMINCEQGAPEGRKQVVVLLTDGTPARDSISYNIQNPSGYFNQLNSRFTGLFKNSELWVIGLDQQNRFWDINKSYWEQIAPGRTQLLRDPSQIQSLFLNIATQAIGEPLSEPRTCDGSSFTVEPYKASLTLILEYPDSNSKAEFLLPSGEKLTRETANVAGYNRSAISESYIITDPVPGEWKCQIIGTGVTPQFRDIQGIFRMTDVSIGHFGEIPSICRDFNLAFTYYDRNHKEIAELPDYPLSHSMTITIDGEPITRQLVAGNDQRTTWRVDGMLSPGATGGTYPLAIDVQLANGSRETIFKDDQLSITIDPRLPCMSIVTPTDGGVSSMHNRLSPVGITLEVELKQGDESTQFNGLFREGLDSIITGELYGPRGLNRTVSLKQDPNKPNLFRAEINDLPDSLTAGGIYTFTATLDATTQQGERYILESKPTSFTRQPGLLWRATQTAIRILAVLSILLVVALVALFVVWISPPYPRGVLIIQRRTTGDAATFRQWDDIHKFNLNAAKFLGFIPIRWICLPVKSQSIQSAVNIKKAKFKQVKQGQADGISVTIYPLKKGKSRDFIFTKHDQARDLGNDFRLLYQNFSKKH